MLMIRSLFPRVRQRLHPQEKRPWTFSPSLGKGFLQYGSAVGLAILILVSLFRLDKTDLDVPLLYKGDTIYYQRMFKNILETGWYLQSDLVGYPGGLDFREFPVGDGWLHLGIIKLIGTIHPNPFAMWNWFYLLTFPLTAVTSLSVCRRVGLSYPIALSISLLYTFLPYHMHRIYHIFLAAYFLVPLASLVILHLFQGKLPFTKGEGTERQWNWKSASSIWLVLLAAMIGMGGVYYALFTLFFVATVGVGRAITERSWQPLWAGGLWGGLICISLAITLWPSLEYKWTNPANADRPERQNQEVEMLGMRITQMVFPQSDHRWGFLRDFKDWYNRSGVANVNENDAATLGFIGSFGFVYLLFRMLYRSAGSHHRWLDGLSLLTVLGYMLACMGGFGAVLGYLFSPWVRGYNRIIVFLALFALLAVGLLLQQFYQAKVTTRNRQIGFWLCLSLGVWFGVLDQSRKRLAPSLGITKYEVENDRDMTQKIEAVVPKGSAIFQLPYSGFPEEPPQNDFIGYDLFRPYLFSDHLKWSYGSIRGHWGDVWMKWVTAMPVERMVETVTEAGFAGIYLDRNGYPDKGGAIEATLKTLLNVEPINSNNSRLAFYSLDSFRDSYQARFSLKERAEQHEKARYPILPLFRKGFYLEQAFPDVGPGRYVNKQAELHLHNASDHDRTIRLQLLLDLAIDVPEHAMTITGLGWSETVRIVPQGIRIDKELIVPPGNHVIHFQSDAKPRRTSYDPYWRKLVFRISKVQVVERSPGH